PPPPVDFARAISEVGSRCSKMRRVAGARQAGQIQLLFSVKSRHAWRMDPVPLLALAVILISAAVSFFFALAETALFSLSKWQVRQLAERDARVGAVTLRL